MRVVPLLLAPILGMAMFAMASGLLMQAGNARAQPNDMATLRDQVAAAIDNAGFNAAVAITDLQTGEMIHVNGHDWRLTGCTINFFILLQTTIDLQEGRYAEANVGNIMSRTVNTSNPVTARDLLFWIGGGDLHAGMQRVDGLMTNLGMETSVFDHPPAYPHETLYGWPNLLTAVEMNHALSQFWHGQVVNFGWRDYLLGKLTESNPGIRYAIPAGTGGGVVSHKMGFFWHPNGWVDNDAGIVRFQRGGETYAYAISIFFQDVPGQYDNVPLGQNIANMAWQFFNARY